MTRTVFVLWIGIFSCVLGSLSSQEGVTWEQIFIKLGEIMAKVEKMETKMEALESLKEIVTVKFAENEAVEQGQLTSYNRSSIWKQRAIPRTCYELQKLEPELPSGEYFIDPDGHGRGESPILVYCDMKTGTTFVTHDSENSVRVTRCRNPGCYSRSVFYKGSLKQITSLTRLSSKCRQLIQYTCLNSPLQREGTDYGWWNDRNGRSHYYWAGSNETSHRCQCGILEECVDSSFSCNCDSSSRFQLTDRGYLTDKQLLPVTSLHFGHTHEVLSSGEHSLGKLECSGRELLPEKPRSCQDLWQMGHTLSGFYTIQNQTQLLNVYCDMNKLPENNDFQSVHHVESVSFYVKSTEHFSTTNAFVTYNVEHVNKGNAMNLTSGLFTAPKSGLYSFTFTGMKDSSSTVRVTLNLQGTPIVHSYSSVNTYDMLILSSMLRVKKGDQIGIKLVKGKLFSGTSDGPYTSFKGFLYEEDWQ